MMLEVIKNPILFWVKKILLYSAFAFIAFVSLSFLIFQFPEVQTALIGRYLKGFSQVIGFPTVVERIDLRWYDRLEMKKVLIKDPEGNEMISVGSLIVNFGFLDLITNGKVNIEAADIDRAKVSLIKIPESDTSKNLNLNIFIKKINQKFSSGKDGQSSAKLNIGEIELDNSQFVYSEPEKDSVKNGFNYRHFHLDVTNGNINAFQVIGDTIQFDVRSLQVQDTKSK